MSFKVDLHVHTKWSGDTDAEPEDLVQEAIGKDLQGIAFTEHYSYEASDYAERLRDKYAGLIAIFRGVEFSAAEGHCLVFGVNTDKLSIRGGAPASELLRAVLERGGVVIPSHPFRAGCGMGKLVMELKGICALEGHNGCNIHSMNVRAVEAASSLGLPYTGGSDAHSPGEVGSCYTEFQHGPAGNGLAAMLKSGDFKGRDIRKISRFALQ